jgi:hypothetical protein
MASHVREAMLLFDNKEAKNLGNQERKRWAATPGCSKKPVFPFISGCFRLFPLIFKGGGGGGLMDES